MFIKRDEHGEIVSLFLHCVPEGAEGFEEVPDDEAVMQAYIEKNRRPHAQPSPEERIAALEEQLAAAKILLGVE